MNNGSGGIAAIVIALAVIMFGSAEFGFLDGFKALADQIIKIVR